MKILIVDDSVDLCDAISKNLRNHGYDTDIVHDGKSGLKMALSNEYDIILLDIMMPQMNGYKVIEKLRNEDRTTPVIFITAKSNIADKIEGLEPGADDYIQKPFWQEIFFETQAQTEEANSKVKRKIKSYVKKMSIVRCSNVSKKWLKRILNTFK